MAIDRRQFLIGAGAFAAGLAGARNGFAVGEGYHWAGCFRAADGSDNFMAFAADGRAGPPVRLPGRGHGMTQRPGTGHAVVFARRPGTFANVIDPAAGRVLHRIATPAERHFQGHGAFTGDGRYLFTTENHYAKGRGVVGIHDAADGYKRIGEFAAQGVGPHETVMMPDGRTLAVSIGGILTHPDAGQAKLNLETMQPALVYIETATGKLLGDYRLAPDLHQLSIRHMAVNAAGTVVVVFQYQGAKTRLVPLVGIHAGEDAIALPSAPDTVTARLRHYCGSVAFERAGERFVVTSPRGNVATLWDARSRRFVAAHALNDVCGAAGAPEPGRFVLASGAGGAVLWPGVADADETLSGAAVRRAHWDNHLLALHRAAS